MVLDPASDNSENFLPIQSDSDSHWTGGSQTIQPDFSYNQKNNKAAGAIAKIFVIGFFLILLILIIPVIITGDSVEVKIANLQQLMLIISGTLIGPLGFIVGFHFGNSRLR